MIWNGLDVLGNDIVLERGIDFFDTCLGKMRLKSQWNPKKAELVPLERSELAFYYTAGPGYCYLKLNVKY